MDSKSSPEALTGASSQPSKPKTLLVHPFTKNRQPETEKPYLLETPNLKRRPPLLELPAEYKKPKLFNQETDSIQKDDCDTNNITNTNNNSEVDGTDGTKSDKKCRCCCSCSQDCHQPVKVIIAPTMIPSIFGPLPSVPYIVKQGKIEKVCGICKYCPALGKETKCS